MQFSVFAPAALAGLGDLPDTLMTRAIVIRMRRRAPNERVQPYRPRQHAAEGDLLRERLSCWAAEVGKDAGGAWPELPEGITDRLAEVWEPIISVADVAGADWPERARAAATHFANIASERAPSLGVRLLRDLQLVFGERTAMFTEAILDELNRMDEAPWGNLRGSQLDARGLANRLRNYGVHSKDVRVGSAVRKGYSRDDLFDPWERYLTPSTPPESATSATSATEMPSVAHVAHVADMGEVGAAACPSCDGEGCDYCEGER